MSDAAHDTQARLAHMAQQIADSFRTYPQDEAARAIADHINHFWTPRMRADLVGGARPSDPLVTLALPMIHLRQPSGG